MLFSGYCTSAEIQRKRIPARNDKGHFRGSSEQMPCSNWATKRYQENECCRLGIGHTKTGCFSSWMLKLEAFLVWQHKTLAFFKVILTLVCSEEDFPAFPCFNVDILPTFISSHKTIRITRFFLCGLMHPSHSPFQGHHQPLVSSALLEGRHLSVIPLCTSLTAGVTWLPLVAR